MARGTAALQNTETSNANTSFANAQSSFGTASQGYNNILANPGYTPGQINTQTVAAQTPYSVQSAQVQGQLARRAATSGNTAGLAAASDAAARQATSDQSQAALGVQTNAANDAQKQTLAALQGQSGLYGQSLSGASSLYGSANTVANARPGFLQYLQGIGSQIGGSAGNFSFGGG